MYLLTADNTVRQVGENGGHIAEHHAYFDLTAMPEHKGETAGVNLRIIRGSRNLVGIAIQLSDSEEEKLFVHDSMQVSPE